MSMAIFGKRYVQLEAPALNGGMGAVVLCSDPNLNRRVAIKFLHHVGVERKRIFDEVKALQRIRSKHVVQVYDIVIEKPGNQIGIVQEFLPGTDLMGFPKTAPDANRYLRALYQLAAGIDDIHSQGLIHRDVKPNNVKYDQEGLLKIFDFGLSRADEDATAQTVGFRGTRGFAAPELYTSGAVRFTRAIDVYAFAATALYLARGTLPQEFTSEPPQAETWAMNRGFATIALKMPAPLVALLDACLATEPRARPSISDVRQCIEQHLVHGQHRALLVHNQKATFCDKANSTVTLSKQNVGSITVRYDGLSFWISAAQGDIYVNNIVTAIGMRIPTSCVITLGGPYLKWQRDFVTMDISHPEVVP
jgi:serine/threonine-protein kinase